MKINEILELVKEIQNMLCINMTSRSCEEYRKGIELVPTNTDRNLILCVPYDEEWGCSATVPMCTEYDSCGNIIGNIWETDKEHLSTLDWQFKGDIDTILSDLFSAKHDVETSIFNIVSVLRRV